MEATPKRAIVKEILWIVATVGLVAAIARFWRGLGATTALSDATPWGLWIGFDVMAGVALAAGGFTIAAAVYIFHLERYRPILRPAILTALLGYGAVIVGLLCDLGLPWHIWKPIFHWQPHSVLFEVAWCVMLYTSVLALEFSPTVLEHSWFRKPIFKSLATWLKRLALPLVILGIVLSTLHQSSLGSLFLIMPFRLHPLWYSPLLPVLFFISAVALGLMMVTLEGFVSAYLFDHPLEPGLFTGLGRATAWVLGLYLIVRLGDLFARGVLPGVLDGSGYSALFLFEIGVSALLPAILLAIPAVRSSRAGLLTCAGLVVGGLALNRLTVGGLAIYPTPGTSYFPAWPEFAVSAGVVAGAALIFLFLAENLNVFGPAEEAAVEQAAAYARPKFDPVTGLHLGRTWWDKAAWRSFVLAPVIALAVALLPADFAAGQRQPDRPVRPARGWTAMSINGNGDGRRVQFDHADHQQRLAEAAGQAGDSCGVCHHLNKPNDEATACWECHRDMNRPVSIFDHTLHQAELGGNGGCGRCHLGEHTAQTAIACVKCHETMAPAAGETKFTPLAPGYREAMHGACITCHEQEAQATARADLARCPACHKVEAAAEPQLHPAQREP